MKNNKYVALALLSSLVLATPAFAQTSLNVSDDTELRVGFNGMMNRNTMMNFRPSVVGTVTAINGNTLIVTSNKMGWGRDGKETRTPKTTPTPIVYTVDATTASVIKTNTASTVSAIAVGDMIMVQGTIIGTNVVATIIRDNVNKYQKDEKSIKPDATPLIQGNGQPIIAGAITAINGSTLTITNKSNLTYTVDATNAKIQNKNALSTVSSLAVGDNVVVQGAINGTSVTAYSVIDAGATPSIKTNTKSVLHGNFFGGIGRFFQHLFGF